MITNSKLFFFAGLVSLLQAYSFGINITVGDSSYMSATAYDPSTVGASTEVRNNAYEGIGWLDPILAVNGNASTYADPHFENYANGAFFEVTGIALNAAGGTAPGVHAFLNVYFTIADPTAYSLSGSFVGEIDTTFAAFVNARMQSALTGSSQIHFERDHEEASTIGGLKNAHVEYDFGLNGVGEGTALAASHGSLSGVLLPGEYNWQAFTQIYGRGDGVGSGFMRLQLGEPMDASSPVPDGGTTAMLLLVSFVGMIGLRRKICKTSAC